MKKKILFIIGILILCSGCSATYKITINDDGSVNETLAASEDTEFFSNYPNSSVGRVVGNILEPYLNTLNSKEYSVSTNIQETKGGATISKKYDSIESYIKNSILYNQFTNKINYSTDGDKVTISAKGAFEKNTQEIGVFNVNSSDIIIELPYKVLENNADEVDGKIYIWKFDEKDTNIREIKLVYDKSKIYNDTSYLTYIAIGVIILFLAGMVYLYLRFTGKRKSVNKI